jgi:hypothetical protein
MDPKEVELVEKFRNRVADVVGHAGLENYHYLVRWLLARDMDVDKAEIMLRKSVGWFKRNEMESILSWKPQKNYYRYAVPGCDFEGCPGK